MRIVSMITLDQLCWIATAAYAVHVLEEYTLDWKTWALRTLSVQCDWPTFYLGRSAVIVLGIVAAQIAPQTPTLALSFPALLLMEATLFHVLPVVLTKGQFSPGLLTAVLLFCPIGFLSYQSVFQTGVLSRLTLITSLVAGVLLAAVPMVFLRLRGNAYFFPAEKRKSTSGHQ